MPAEERPKGMDGQALLRLRTSNRVAQCVQRTVFAKPDEQGELRMWLDCTSGLKRGDISVPAGERVYLCTQCWDDAEGLKELLRYKSEVDAEVAGSAAGAANSRGDDDADQLWDKVPMLGEALKWRRRYEEQEAALTLKQKAAYVAQNFPDLGDDARPAQIAPQGTLSLKRTRGAGPFAKSSYHILGTFSVEPLLGDD